ncbi:hypothetical protein, partial [Pseudomonas viridiflava]|uniref:hypothetical protein n=1 Tax=Pseudomonas viridiflava TaxID=33069 RepID=UPI0019822F11
NNELADIELEGCIELSVFLGHGKSSMGIVSPIEVSGVIRPAQSAGNLQQNLHTRCIRCNLGLLRSPSLPS